LGVAREWTEEKRPRAPMLIEMAHCSCNGPRERENKSARAREDAVGALAWRNTARRAGAVREN
jgi:hypothetical protein